MAEIKKRQILLVAGDFNIVEAAQTALRDKHLVIQNAFTHIQALFMLRDERFDLVVVDAAMFDRHSKDITVKTLAKALQGVPMVAVALDPLASEHAKDTSALVITDTLRETIREAAFSCLNIEDETRRKGQTEHLTGGPKSAAERRIEEIQTLFALGKTLTEVLDLNEVLNRIVEAARRLTNADEGMILMPGDDEKETLYLRAKVGIEQEVAANFRIRTADTIAGEVFKSGSPSLIGARGPQRVKTEYFVNSLLYVPIISQGKPIGVLGVNNKSKSDLFDINHQELLTNLSSYAAIAIENARIHEESLQRARELASLVEASRIVNSSLALDETLPNICQQLARIANVTSTEIYDWEREANQLRCIARYQRAVYPIHQGPRLRLAQYPAFKAAVENDSLLVVKRSAASPSPEVELLKQLGTDILTFIPISAQGRSVGVLFAYSIRQQERLADPAVIGRARHSALEALAGILSQPGQPPSATRMTALERLLELLEADWYELAIVSQDGDALITTVELGTGVWLEPPFPTIDLRLHPLLLKMLNAKETIVSYPNRPLTAIQSALPRAGSQAILAIPLIQRGETNGLVVFADTHRSHVYQERDIDMSKAIVGQAATALENAQLVHELEQRLVQLRDAQERLVQTARLSAMGELAAVVAHQINNPLTTIVADAELILMDEPPDSENYESLQSILRAGKRAASVARRLLSIARPEDPDAPPERIDVIDTIRGVLALVKTHIERDGIQILDDLPNDPLPSVGAIRGRLDDVWLNLLLNAHDALLGRKDAKIGIEIIPKLDVGLIDVVVWDNGPGIPEHIRDEVFRPFFTTKPAGEGTGLGLHICKQTVETIGGQMFLEEKAGQGARFVVRLPIMPDA